MFPHLAALTRQRIAPGRHKRDGSLLVGRPPGLGPQDRQARPLRPLHPVRGSRTRARMPRAEQVILVAQGERLSLIHISLNADNPVQENINFGYVKKHAISGNVYLDQNRDKTKNTGDLPQGGVTVKPVSYTHLDVYKRQA